MRFASVLLILCFLPALSYPQAGNGSNDASFKTVEHLQDFPVIEFRRYTIKEGERDHFATYFEAFFPEAFEQLGAIAAGEFLERDKPLGFTWIRGFRSMDDRARINATFYYGPVWKEHKAKLNSLMTDSDNVLLLHPISVDRSIRVLPAVDPVVEMNDHRGVVVAQIFTVKTNAVDDLLKQAEPLFAKYRAAGIREVAVLATLDVTNNFPQLPVRTDGPYVVWLGMVRDSAAVDALFLPAAKSVSSTLGTSGLLRSDPEIVILDPTPRSRLRWR
jgi:hypothetical protein